MTNQTAEVWNLYFTEINNLTVIGPDQMEADIKGIDLDQFVAELTPEQKGLVLDAIGSSDVMDWWHEQEKESYED